MATTTLTRRSAFSAGLATLVAGGVLAPAMAEALVIMPPLASAFLAHQNDAWRVAKLAFVRAQQEHERYYSTSLQPAAAALKPYQVTTNPDASKNPTFRRLWEKYRMIEEHSDHLFDLKQKALTAMVVCPGPDLAAIKFKMEAVIADQAWEEDHWDGMIASIMCDLDRLGGA